MDIKFEMPSYGEYFSFKKLKFNYFDYFVLNFLFAQQIFTSLLYIAGVWNTSVIKTGTPRSCPSGFYTLAEEIGFT